MQKAGVCCQCGCRSDAYACRLCGSHGGGRGRTFPGRNFSGRTFPDVSMQMAGVCRQYGCRSHAHAFGGTSHGGRGFPQGGRGFPHRGSASPPDGRGDSTVDFSMQMAGVCRQCGCRSDAHACRLCGSHGGGGGRSFPGRTFPGRTSPGGTFPGRTFPGGTFPGGTFPGRTSPGRTSPGGRGFRVSPGRVAKDRWTRKRGGVKQKAGWIKCLQKREKARGKLTTLYGVEPEKKKDADGHQLLLWPDAFGSSDLGGAARYRNLETSQSIYTWLTTQPLSCNRQRHFVYGALYNRPMRQDPFLIDGGRGPVDIKVTVGGVNTIINIRQLGDDPDGLLPAIVDLGGALKGNGNARRGVGDMGAMHAMGMKNWGKMDPYATNREREEHISRVSRKANDCCQRMLPTVRDDIVKADVKKRKRAGNPEFPLMDGGLGSVLMVSENLGNSSHYDLDDSLCFAVWAEAEPNTARKWYFILPSLSINGSKGVVVQLRHGTAIAWDARLLRHCTSVTEVGVTEDGVPNVVYGTAFGSFNR